MDFKGKPKRNSKPSEFQRKGIGDFVEKDEIFQYKNDGKFYKAIDKFILSEIYNPISSKGFFQLYKKPQHEVAGIEPHYRLLDYLLNLP
jgi:hypothetical protein